MTVLAETLAADNQGSGGSSLFTIFLFAILIVGFFLLTSRSRKAQKKASDFRSTLEPGQDVVTASGMLGRIVAVDGDEITVESVPGGARTRWLRGAIARAATPADEATPTTPGSPSEAVVGATTTPAFTEERPLEIPDDLVRGDRGEEDDDRPSGTTKN